MRDSSVRLRNLRALLIAAMCLAVVTAQAAQPTLTAPPSKELQQKLLHAVIQDQIEAVPDLLKQGGDPNAHVEPAQEDAWILQHGINDDPSPPLFSVACRFGSIKGPKIIQMLLDKGANVNITDSYGVTPLMSASQLNIATSLLLEHGAKVNVKDNNGKTPLMYAMNNRGLNTASQLLEHGADINAQDADGQTALMIAIRQAVHDNVWLIPIPGMEKEKRKKEEKASYLGLIQFLIEKRADVNLKDKTGNTALQNAIAQNQSEVARLLRKAGAKK